MSAQDKNPDELKDLILYSISHDLKSPITAIMGFTNYLLKDIASNYDPIWIETLRRVTTASEQTLNLVSDIIIMSKLNAGKEFIEPHWFADPEREFMDMARTFQPEADSKMITLSYRREGTVPPVFWDMRKVRYRILNNVISNALKFTPREGEVRFIVSSCDGIVTMRVEDTGPGIPASETERIFTVFEQLELSSVRVYGSAGLGLSNAKRFVELHGGRIFVDAIYDGGAGVVIELPEKAPFRAVNGLDMNYGGEFTLSHGHCEERSDVAI